MSEKINSGAGGVGGGMNKKSSPGRHIGGENDVESSGVDIKKEPDELARVSCEPHPLIDADERFSSNFITELDSGDQFSSNFKTERDLECSSFQLSSNVKSELYDPEGGDISETEESEHNLPREMKVKSEPTDDYGLEPGDTLPPASESEEWVGAGSELGPVPLCLIPAAGRRGLLRIDVEDPLHPVPSGAVKELPGDDDMEESSCGFGDNAASDDQNMEDDDNTGTSLDQGYVLAPSTSTARHHLKTDESLQYDMSRRPISVVLHSHHENQHLGKNALAYQENIDTVGEKNIPGSQILPREFACDKCSHSFEDRKTLSNHKREEHGRQPVLQIHPNGQCNCKTYFAGTKYLGERECLFRRIPQQGKKDLKRVKDSSADQSGKSKSQQRLTGLDQSLETSSPAPQNTHGVLTRHTGEIFACDQCDKKFGTQVYLLQHRRKQHHKETTPSVQEAALKKESLYTCSICSKVFKRLYHLKRHHWRFHVRDNPFKCDRCDESFRFGIRLKNHMRVRHGDERPFACDECDKTFTREIDLKRHVFSIHRGPNPFACDQCDKTYMRNGELLFHKRTTHTGERPFKCDQCDKTFTRRDILKGHKLTHTEERPFSCDQCDKAFKKPQKLAEHKLIHSADRPMFICDQCGSSFTANRYLKEHYKSHTGETYSCDQCDKTYRKNSELLVHKRLHTGERPFKCDQCDKTFTNVSNLRVHKLTHTEERPYACDQCDKSFKRKQFLAEHKIVHSADRPFKCNQCAKTFTYISNLRDHKLTHTEERPYACDQCDKAFKRKSALAHHKLIHSTDRPMFICDQCGSSFTTKQSLKEHYRSHTGEINSCDQCDKTYVYKGDLVVHKRIHTGETPYKCDQCDKSFTQFKILRDHKLFIHS